MVGRLQGKIAIITGAGSGIGEATAKLFAREGAEVTVADVKVDRAQRVAGEILAAGGRAHAAEVNVGDWDSVHGAVEAVVARSGRIDVLHNNAAAIDEMMDDSNILDMSIAAWNFHLNVNLTGVMLGCRAVIPHMIRQGGGSIINTSSQAYRQVTYIQPAYCATKAGVNGLSRQLAVCYGKHGVRCNVVAPGLIETDNVRRFLPQGLRDEFSAHVTTPRLGVPDDIAHAALFLASDESGYVNGAVFDIDGGIGVPMPTVAYERRMRQQQD